MSDKKYIQSESLPVGWKWIDYDDGSGGLCSPDKKSYFSYDLATQEYVSPTDGHWHFMNNYPERTFLCEFKEFAENWIKERVLMQEKRIDKQGEKYKIKIPKHIFTKLKEAQEVYFENKEEDENDCLSGTQDSYMNEMLEQDLWELLNTDNVREIWNTNIGILEHFKIEDDLTFRQKEVRLYHRLLEDFTDNIENNLTDAYEEVIGAKDIEIDVDITE